MRAIRGNEIAMIFQDPMTSLNPAMPIGRQITEPLIRHMGMSQLAAAKRASDLLGMVGIASPRSRLADYPHQFSGGMRQRVMIAIALSCEPSLLIADEPTTALDVTIQAQILELIAELTNQLHMSTILITHDMGVVAGLADRVCVMYAGRVVESAEARSLFHTPRHPYTEALLESVPRIDRPRPNRLTAIDGFPPNLVERIVGCPFEPRCAHAIERCRVEAPAPRSASEAAAEHVIECHVDIASVGADAASGGGDNAGR